MSPQDLAWADAVLVMEAKHKSRLRGRYARALLNKPLYVLDIPDQYRFMDPELVELLETAVGGILGPLLDEASEATNREH